MLCHIPVMNRLYPSVPFSLNEQSLVRLFVTTRLDEFHSDPLLTAPYLHFDNYLNSNPSPSRYLYNYIRTLSLPSYVQEQGESAQFTGVKEHFQRDYWTTRGKLSSYYIKPFILYCPRVFKSMLTGLFVLFCQYQPCTPVNGAINVPLDSLWVLSLKLLKYPVVLPCGSP